MFDGKVAKIDGILKEFFQVRMDGWQNEKRIEVKRKSPYEDNTSYDDGKATKRRVKIVMAENPLEFQTNQNDNHEN